MPNIDPISPIETEPAMLAEYDFSKAVRGNPRQYLEKKRRQGLQQATDNGHSVFSERVVHIKTVEIKNATVTPDGTLTVKLPKHIDAGEYQVTVLIHEPKTS